MGIGKIDFFVPWTDNEKELAHSQIEYAFLERNRAGKNTFVAHTGKSREGKSSMTLKEIEFMLANRGLDAKDYVNKIFIYTPFEYGAKVDAILHDRELKEIPFVVIDDARFVVGAKNWQQFMNRAIADISSIAGRIKPLTIYLNTLFLKDIDYDFRLALDFWGSVHRPLHGPAEMRYYRFWLDERDPEKLRMRKRKFRGVVVKGSRHLISEPNKYVFSMPSKELWDIYDTESYKAKGRIIRRKLDELISHLKKEAGFDNRLNALLQFYSEPGRYDALMQHFEFKYKKLRLRKDAFDVLSLSKDEGREFTALIQERLKHIQQNEITGETLGGG